jgi:hypothetical protein
MNDFSEIENELKKMRPAAPSPVLFERVEEALENSADREPAGSHDTRWWRRFTGSPYGIGISLAAAAVLLLLVRIHLDRPEPRGGQVAQSSPDPTRETTPVYANRFIPAAATQVVYNKRDEGLQFASGYEQPLRRLRYQTRETMQWRNPATGESLRVSYPSEEIVLIPVSGQ